MPPSLFAATAQFRTGHAALYEFVHGATAALWNTRWQVGGYLAAVPDAARDDLQHRFVTGSGIHGVNVRKTFVDQTWPEQKEELARITLINTVALYEAWTENIANTFRKKSLAAELQFPTRGYAGRTRRGVRDALAGMCASASPSIAAELAPALRKQRSFHDDKLDELLVVYRYFKELRNAEVHGGGLAPAVQVGAYNDLKNLTAKSVGLKELPEHHQPTVDARTPLSLRGAIGLGAVTYSLVTTIDVLLAPTSQGERAFIHRFDQRYDGSTLPSTDPRRSARIRAIIEKAGFPRLGSVDLLTATLKAQGVII